MGLRIWLPLNGDLHNQGLDGLVNASVQTGVVVDNNGKIGKCYTNNGTATPVANNVTLNSDSFSICAWVKINTLRKGWQTSVKMFGSGTYLGLGCEHSDGVRLGFYFYKTIDGTSKSVFNTYPCVPQVDTWVHYSMVYDGTKRYIYENGILKTSDNVALPNTPVEMTSLYLFETNTSLNDVRIYDHALSPREIKEISKGLVCHYMLSNGGGENLLSRYVVPGQNGPTSTATSGRTNWLGDYKIKIPATESADTYFRLFTTKQLTANATYTISCQVDGLLDGSYYNFPLFAQNNAGMGVLQLNHNGLCSLTFTMTYGTQTTATGANGETVYICFMDDLARSLVSGQGAITLSNFKLESGSVATPWTPNPSDPEYTKMGFDDGIEYDVSGYGHNGTKVGTITYDTDTPRYWTSSIFDGDTSLIKISDLNLHPMLGSEWTCAFWVYNNDNGNRSIFFSGYGFTTGAAFGIEKTTGNVTRIYWASSPEVLPSGFTVPVGQWCHLAFVGTPTSIKSYLNGELKHTYSGTLDVSKLVANTTYGIGRDIRTGATAFKGKMSDVRFYATCLSDADIQQLYNTPISLSSNGTLLTQGELTEV